MGKPTKILHNVAVGVVLNDVLDPLIAVLIYNWDWISSHLSLSSYVPTDVMNWRHGNCCMFIQMGDSI